MNREREYEYVHWALILAVAASVLWLSWPTLAGLHPRWTESGYSHGYLILIMSGALAWQALRARALAPAEPSLIGALLLPIPVVFLLAGQAATTIQLSQLALPLLWFCALWAVAGTHYATRLVWAFGFIYFAIPIWDIINGALQSLTVVVVSMWLRVLEIPAFIDGNFIYLPAGTFEVAGGCSGLSYLIVGLALASYIGLSHHDRWSWRIALVGLAFVTALLGNWARVFGVIIAGHLTDMQHFLVTKDHLYFGWVLFLLLCFLPLLLVDRWLSSLRGSSPGTRVAEVRFRLVPLGASGAGILLIVICMSVLAAWAQSAALQADRRPLSALVPVSVAGWEEAGPWDGSSRPVYRGADAEAGLRYARDGTVVNVYRAAYVWQEQGKEVVYFANRPGGSSGQLVNESTAQVPESAVRQRTLTEMEIVDGRSVPRLLWLGRRIGGHWIATDLEAKAWQAIGAVTGHRDAYVLVLSTDCGIDCESARATLSEFAEAAGPPLFGYGETTDE